MVKASIKEGGFGGWGSSLWLTVQRHSPSGLEVGAAGARSIRSHHDFNPEAERQRQKGSKGVPQPFHSQPMEKGQPQWGVFPS